MNGFVYLRSHTTSRCSSYRPSSKICILHKSNYAFIRAESPRDVWTVNCVHTKQRASLLPVCRCPARPGAYSDAMWIMFMYSPPPNQLDILRRCITQQASLYSSAISSSHFYPLLYFFFFFFFSWINAWRTSHGCGAAARVRMQIYRLNCIFVSPGNIFELIWLGPTAGTYKPVLALYSPARLCTEGETGEV